MDARPTRLPIPEDDRLLSPADRKAVRRKRLKRIEASAAKLRRALVKGGVSRRRLRSLASDD